MADDLCPICCDVRLTASKTVDCSACDHRCCRNCMKRYLLDLMDDPQCMGCRRRLTHTHLVAMLPRTFVNKELRQHREAVLLDRQKAMIPASQDAVEQERRKRQSLKRIRDWTEQREALKRQMQQLNVHIHHEYVAMSRRQEPTERRQFTMKCCVEGCRGFLSESYKCSVCEASTCPQCLTLKEPGHQCNADDVATVALLRRDSKRCPTCSTWIHRYEGCTQMFCTSCTTLFDYRTLRILGDRDHVHNPHYTEWLARQRTSGTPAREAGDVPCGGMPHVRELHEALVRFYNRGFPATHFPRVLGATMQRQHPEIERILATHRSVLHLEHELIDRYRPRVDDAEFAEMRVQYCLQDFDEATWRTRLQRMEKGRNKRNEIFLVLEMVVHACGDLFRQMHLAASARQEGRTPEAIFGEVEAVLLQANRALCQVSATFGCSVPLFHTDPAHPNRRMTIVSHATARQLAAQQRGEEAGASS